MEKPCFLVEKEFVPTVPKKMEKKQVNKCEKKRASLNHSNLSANPGHWDKSVEIQRGRLGIYGRSYELCFSAGSQIFWDDPPSSIRPLMDTYG